MGCVIAQVDVYRVGVGSRRIGSRHLVVVLSVLDRCWLIRWV